ncbi:MAG: bifunctional UDP-N-acetylglucosamine diphosphorylase/glucosamine-1-phosphate N-acetyltransferase GlmU [Porticoccaceae bacterium]
MSRAIDIVVLAAGRGSRMRSAKPKVLHPLAGQPMIEHVLAATQGFDNASTVVVSGHGAEQLEAALADYSVNFARQQQQRGTADAVATALDQLREESVVLVLYGDVPLIEADTLHRLVAQVSSTQMALLTVSLQHPDGYGRILRNDAASVTGIVEHKDATAEQRNICEVNTGVLAIEATQLRQLLPRIGCDNAQGEYYLTDLIELAVASGITIAVTQPKNASEVEGVNDRIQLARLERIYQRRQADLLLDAGATLADPDRFDLRGTVTVGEDVFIDINVLLEGDNQIGNNVVIGPHCHLIDAVIGDNVTLKSHTIVEQSEIGADSVVGPFARLRPGTQLAEGCKIGNFVETKKVTLGSGSKINHLSYVGDAILGSGVNVGAGTITCNYDGVNKHQTIIGDRAFIGSNSALVAPVNIGAGATVGAGSTIARDVDADKLALTRAKQMTVPGWKKPIKQ